MMVESLPLSAQLGESQKTFVLHHPDFNYQNILAKEYGTVTAFIDWDKVDTSPLYIGYSKHPSWLTRDWDPIMYGYGNPRCEGRENSPEDSSVIVSIMPMQCVLYDTRDRSSLPQIRETVFIAAFSPICKTEIVKKSFNLTFHRKNGMMRRVKRSQTRGTVRIQIKGIEWIHWTFGRHVVIPHAMN
jgi:hypothetical protein